MLDKFQDMKQHTITQLVNDDHIEIALTDVKEEYVYLSTAEWTQVEQYFGV